MDLKKLLLKPAVLWHVSAVAVFVLISCIYFYPALQGYSVKSGDVKNWVGVSQEIQDYKQNEGEQVLWTNSIFSGMPATQIAMSYEGLQIPVFVRSLITFWLPTPISYLLMYFLGFYLMAVSFRIKPLFGILGAIAFGFSSYFIVIIEAGHITKALALGYAPLLIAGFIFAYRWKNWILGVGLSALFMTLELIVNHVQITYYFGFILIALGIVEFVRYYKEKQLPKFAKITLGLLVAYGLAVAVNIGNIRGTLEYTPYTMRGGAELTPKVDSTDQTIEQTDPSGGLSTDYITHWSYGKAETFTLLVPNFNGGYSKQIGGNPDNKAHLKKVDGSKQWVAERSQYWGDQPGTSGPVYVGAVVFLLAILSLIYVKDNRRWALLAVTILAILLSWGKNFLGFTEFFLNVFPMYNKFRTVTMILVIVELCLPLLAILFLHRLYKNREEIAANIKPFLYVSGGTLFLLLLMAIMPTVFTTFISTQESDFWASVADIDPRQVEFFDNSFPELMKVRRSIFVADVWRSFAFVFLGAVVVLIYIRKIINANVMGIILGLLVLVDMMSVDKRYLGNEKKGTGYAQWQEEWKRNYPYAANDAEDQIFALEALKNPQIQVAADSAMSEIKETFSEDMKGAERQRLLDWEKFRAMNRLSHFRVYEAGNLTSSSYVPYFYKGIGGYHGAKLSRYQELIENQLALNNKVVFSMLNTRYIVDLVQDQYTGEIKNSRLIEENKNALGNAWFVKTVKVVPNADAEMAALNVKSTYEFVPMSVTPLMIDGVETKETRVLQGTEKIEYVNISIDPAANFALRMDTIEIPQQTTINPGEKICLISHDTLGLRFVYDEMLDTADTITNRIFTYENLGSTGFEPAVEAVMNQEFAEKLSSQTFSGDGTIELTSYHPDQMVYKSSSSSNQLAVFSEIYYPVGWKAFVDEKEVPISRVNYVLRAIEVPGGDHTIKFTYELDSYKSSGIIAWISVLVILVLIGVGSYIGWKSCKTEEVATEGVEKEA